MKDQFQRLPKVALDTGKMVVTPALIFVIQDLTEAGLNAHEINAWIHTPNTELDYHPPMELLLQGQGGRVRAMITKTAEAERQTKERDVTQHKDENVSGIRGVPLNDDDRFQ